MISLTRLILEVSFEELEKQYVETKKISKEDFEAIKQASGNKSAYGTWLAKRVTQGFILPEDIYKYEEYFEIFNRRKRDFPMQDIFQYKTKKQLEDLEKLAFKISQEEKANPTAAVGVEKKDVFAKFKVGEVNGFKVYKIPKGHPEMHKLACELGTETRWCTAVDANPSHFRTYIQQGSLFVFIKGSEKYQFHFPVGNATSAQFKDNADHEIQRLYIR